jgi:hypothetical protein
MIIIENLILPSFGLCIKDRDMRRSLFSCYSSIYSLAWIIASIKVCIPLIFSPLVIACIRSGDWDVHARVLCVAHGKDEYDLPVDLRLICKFCWAPSCTMTSPSSCSHVGKHCVLISKSR